MRYAGVIVDTPAEPIDRPFTYAVPEDMALEAGERVLVPFAHRDAEGYVLSLSEQTDVPPDKLKRVIRRLDGYAVLLPEQLELGAWLREKYRCTLCEAFRQMIPAQMRLSRVKEKTRRWARLTASDLEAALAQNARSEKRRALLTWLSEGEMPLDALNAKQPGASARLKQLEEQGFVELFERGVRRRPYDGLPDGEAKDPPLTEQQKEALSALLPALRGGGGRFLLHGVTGSGKTEVYIRVIREALSRGQTAIVLVPEISLTPQMTDWFRARFGAVAAVLHSRLSPGERFDEWRRIRLGEARVVIGARSAVFAPAQNLGALIVDEEHESSYLSERRPCYDAREVARFRAEQSGAVLILGSATPSIESYMKAMPGVRPENRITLLEMPNRVAGRALPDVQIVDMRKEILRGNRSIFSGALLEALGECLGAGKQAILFLNRRGYSTFVSCRACGYVVKCAQCDVSMTYHMTDGLLRCHYCGSEARPPARCPECGSPYIRYFGTGTQKVEEEMRKRFPDAPVARMDLDTTSGKDAHEKILSAFRRGETRVLVGTQMIAKGLDFPNVTLVGVVAADLSLHVSDYRSVERTFQLLTQVEGRAGRADAPGRVIVQSYDPEHYGIQLAAKQDFRAFYFEEVKRRRRGLFPPYTILARLLVTAREEGVASACAAALEEKLNAFLDASPEYRRDVVQARALEAPFKLLRGEARWQVFIKMYARDTSNAILSFMEGLEREGAQEARIELEVNPASMM